MESKHFEFNEEDIAEGKYDAWDLIQPLWFTVNIYEELEVYNKDLTAFTEAQRRFFALFWYDAEVCNGGHDQFLANSTGIVWKDALECMQMVGALKLADNFQKVIDMFGGKIPFDRGEREDMLELLHKDKSFDYFDEIDSFYYADENYMQLRQLMDDYAKNHASEFVVNGDYLYWDPPI